MPPAATVEGGILSASNCCRDLVAFTKEHQEALNQVLVLGLEFKWCPSAVTFLNLFNGVHLQVFEMGLHAWLIGQISRGDDVLEMRVCDGKELRCLALETEDGNHRFVAQVTVYARDLRAREAPDLIQSNWPGSPGSSRRSPTAQLHGDRHH